MAFEMVTAGGLLVEIMRKELDKPFTAAADLTGPYPSGDVAIFIDTAARLGMGCGMIGAVGPDDFGRCLTNRLEADGVDTGLITVAPNATTGCAFVAYSSDGSRTFIYHWRDSAASCVDLDSITPEKLAGVKWAHATGCNMSVSENLKAATLRMLECVPHTAKVSFDPNIRPEVLSVEQIRELCAPLFERCDIFFPSKNEAKMFTGLSSDDEGCRALAAKGKTVVLKKGTEGCDIYDGGSITHIDAFPVKEVDPTGAGDSFCAAFLTALSRGKSLDECGRFACAVGALSVTKTGPMEGAPTMREVEEFCASIDSSK